MQKDLCDSETQEASRKDVGGIMEVQVDSRPPDEHGKEEEGETVSREPVGKEGCHHEGVDRVAARKARVENFPRPLGQL